MQMHRDFLKLVAAYNAVGMFNAATNAQNMAVALHQFESDHIITNMQWPPRLVERNGMKIIAPVDEECSIYGLHRDIC